MLSGFTRQQLKPFPSVGKRQDLLTLADLLAAGQVTPVIDRMDQLLPAWVNRATNLVVALLLSPCPDAMVAWQTRLVGVRLFTPRVPMRRKRGLPRLRLTPDL